MVVYRDGVWLLDHGDMFLLLNDLFEAFFLIPRWRYYEGMPATESTEIRSKGLLWWWWGDDTLERGQTGQRCRGSRDGERGERQDM